MRGVLIQKEICTYILYLSDSKYKIAWYSGANTDRGMPRDDIR
jgi:hypothetical protein